MSLLSYLQSKAIALVDDSNATGTITSLAITPPKSKTALAGANLLIINRVDGSETSITLTSDINIGDRSISFTSIYIEGTIMSGSLIVEPQKERLDRIDTSIQYINFSSQFSARTDWVTFSTSGISNQSWNTHTGDSGVIVGTSILQDVTTAIQSVGIVIPFDCTLIGVDATTFRVGNYQSAVGLFVGTPAYNDFETIDMTLRAYAEADNSAGPDTNYSQRPVKAIDLTSNFALSAGDIILPAAIGLAHSGGNLRVSYTIVLKTTKLL